MATRVFYGYKPSGAPGVVTTENTAILNGSTSTHNLIASVEQKVTTGFSFWATDISIECGRATATNASIAGAVYNVDGSLNPTSLRGKTNAYTAVTVAKTGTTDGTWLTANVAAPFVCYAGTNYALAAHAVTADVNIGMIEASALGTVDDTLFYACNRATASIPDPYPTFTASTQGHLAVYVGGDLNTPPIKPGTTSGGLTSAMSPAAGAVVNTTRPTFTADFRDNEETLSTGASADKLAYYRVVVKDNAGNWIWDSGQVAASGAMQTARQSTVQYPAPGTPGAATLVNGGAYKWTVMLWDSAGAASPWADDHAFTVAVGGSFAPLTPTTAKQGSTTPTPYTATWSHQSALTLVSGEVHLLNPDGSVAHFMNTVKTFSPAVASGATASITWTEAGFSPALVPGSSYTVEWRGTDSAAVQTGWYRGATFAVDAAPDVPSGLTPTGTGTVYALPLLSCSCLDSDDTVASGLIVKARIKTSTGTVLFTRQMTLLPGSDRVFTYQTTGTDLASFATYTWDAYAFDGDFYSGSGGITVEANATKSANGGFVYAAPPTLTVTAPTSNQVITTATPTYTWTTSSPQVTKHLVLTRTVDTKVIWDSGVVTSATTNTPQPAGYLRNGVAYLLTITATDATNVSFVGTRPFSLSYPAPAAIVPTLNLLLRPGDTAPTAVDLTWTASVDPAFLAYVVTRRAAADVDVGAPQTWLTTIVSLNQTEFVDDTARAGVPYVYGLSQQTTVGTDVLQSAVSEVAVTLAFTQAIVANAANPLVGRVLMEGRNSRTLEQLRDQKLIVPWGATAPLEFKNATSYGVLANEFVLVGSDVQALAAWEALVDLDAGEDPVVYRDGRGNLVYGAITALKLLDDPMAPRRVQLTITETTAQPTTVKPAVPVLPALPPPPLLKPLPGIIPIATSTVASSPQPPGPTPNALVHWSVLHIVFLKTAADGVTYVVPDAEAAAAFSVIAKFPGLVDTLSAGRAQIRQTVLQTTSAVTKTSPAGTGGARWCAPADMAGMLAANKAKTYDHVFVHVPVEGVDAAPYRGLSATKALPGGYTYIPISAAAGWGADPYNVLVHEWGHEVTAVFTDRGFPMPNLDRPQDYHRDDLSAYTSAGDWTLFLQDFLRGFVVRASDSHEVGCTDAAWKSGAPVTGFGTTGNSIAPVTVAPTPAPTPTPPAPSPAASWPILTPSNPVVNDLDFRLLSYPMHVSFIPTTQTNQRPGIPMQATSSTWHDTGNTSAGDRAFQEQSWIRSGAPGGTDTQVSVHFFVDDIEGWHIIPTNEVAWHAGDGGNGPGNRTSIAIEECVNSDRNVALTRQHVQELHALIQMTMFHGQHLAATTNAATLPNGHVALAQHNYFSGKDCPHTVRSAGLWSSMVSAINTKMGT